MPRGKRNTPAEAVAQQTDLETAIAEAKEKLLAELRAQTPADLIKRYRDLDNWMSEQRSKLNDYLKPHAEVTEAINGVLMEKALKEKVNNYATDFGTAYISRGFSYKVDPNAKTQWVDPETGEISTGREAVLDWALAHWNDYGSQHLTVNLAADGIKAYAAATQSPEHPEGLLPPGISAERWQRMNIRKS